MTALVPALLLSMVASTQSASATQTFPRIASIGGDSVSVALAALTPDTVFAPPEGPRIVMLGAEGQGVAALRISVPLTEGPVEQGAGEILRSLALARMEALARPVGARVSATRTPWGLAYEVQGAAADFEYLAYLIRVAVAEPDTAAATVEVARQHLAEAQARAQETPGGRIASELRAMVAPGLAPLEGSPATLNGLDAARIHAVWSRSHQASAMTLVISAPLVPEVVLAATRGMGSPEEDAAPPPEAPAPPSRSTTKVQTLRTWYGEAFEAGADRSPVTGVAALLLADALRARSGSYETGVELWDLPARSVLVLTGAAYPRDASAMRRAVSGTLDALRSVIDPDAVRRARARARADVLMHARTAGGLVEVVGRALEPDGEPGAAAAHLAALAGVDPDAVTALLDRMQSSGPVHVEVRP